MLAVTRALARLRRDRRGATAVIIATAASSLLGMAALATEAGNWYLVRRNAQNTADAAALAGAIAMTKGGDYASVGRNVASRNGFTNGGDNGRTVVNATSPAANQVTVSVQQTQQLLLARIFTGLQPPVITVSARASAITDPGGACLLALHAPVTFAGNSNVQAPTCGFASNFRDTNSFKFGSGGSDAGSNFTARLSSLISMGGCATCTTAQNTLKLTFTLNRPAFYQPATVNPYADLEAGPPSYIASSKLNGCVPPQKLDSAADNTAIALPPNYPGNSRTVDNSVGPCYKTIKVTGGKTLQLSPGIYVISDGSFTVGGGTRVTCPTCTSSNGVAIVLTGTGTPPTSVGGINIQANATVDLTARNSGSGSGLDGVLFYRDGRMVDGNGSPPVNIAGGATIKLRGAIVAPSSNVLLIGSSSTSTDPTPVTSCTVFVVGGITFQGGAGLDTSGCAATGTRTPTLQFIQLLG